MKVNASPAVSVSSAPSAAAEISPSATERATSPRAKSMPNAFKSSVPFNKISTEVSPSEMETSSAKFIERTCSMRSPSGVPSVTSLPRSEPMRATSSSTFAVSLMPSTSTYTAPSA